MLKKITLFSSGSLTQEGTGSYRLLLTYQHNTKEWVQEMVETTQERLQLSALIKGLSMLQEPCTVTVYTDAPYIEKGASVWLDRWDKRDFTHVLNSDLWQAYLHYTQRHTVQIVLLESETFEHDYSQIKTDSKTV